MGFWDLVKKGAKVIKEQATNFNEDVKKYKEMYEDYDTERLKSLCIAVLIWLKKWLLLVFLKIEGK